MKNEIYKFEINKNILFELAKYFDPNIKKTDLYKIYTIKDQVEISIAKYLDQIFSELKDKKTDISYKEFLGELNKEK